MPCIDQDNEWSDSVCSLTGFKIEKHQGNGVYITIVVTNICAQTTQYTENSIRCMHVLSISTQSSTVKMSYKVLNWHQLTLNSTVTETYTTAFPGLLARDPVICCPFKIACILFCKTNIIGWWSPYSNISNILIWVSLDFSQPWALEIHYIEKKNERWRFEKKSKR